MRGYINKKGHNFNPVKAVGKGGEADVYKISNDLVAKIFKQPSHPDYTNNVPEQEGARKRLKEHQSKLKSFPSNLPQNVITPIDLVTEKDYATIIGYTMKYLDNTIGLYKYSDINYRNAGISNEEVIETFKNLYHTLDQLHKSNVVVGDFNDLNVLINNSDAFLIDADSMQFDKYLCRMFTKRFVDPLLCLPDELLLSTPHNELSDWYAFNVMLFQSLLFVDPYGGVYKPKDKSKKIPHDKRPLQRITVFDDEVVYPKKATPYDVLPKELLEHFKNVFTQDKRMPFPSQLLDIKWTVDSNLGNIGVVVPHKTTVTGKVSATELFKTKGRILQISLQKGRLFWIYHEDNAYKRENSETFLEGKLNHKIKFRLNKEKIYIGKNREVLCLNKNKTKIVVDKLQGIPLFDVNYDHIYWLQNGTLKRDGKYSSENIGDALEDQTLFWLGDHYGFGFYRAGELKRAFLFKTDSIGLNYNVDVPEIQGQLVDAACCFSEKMIWFFTTTSEQGDLINRAYAINPTGKIVGRAHTMKDDDSWLGNIRGKTSAGKALFSSTDYGIIRLGLDSFGQISEVADFPDTEPYVSDQSKLFVSKEGLYVASYKDVKLLKIKP